MVLIFAQSRGAAVTVVVLVRVMTNDMFFDISLISESVEGSSSHISLLDQRRAWGA